MTRKFGQVKPFSDEWTLQRHPDDRISVSRVTMELIQAENAMLHDILVTARRVADISAWHGEDMFALRTALARYDGWTDDPEVRSELVQKLLAIVDDLDHDGC